MAFRPSHLALSSVALLAGVGAFLVYGAPLGGGGHRSALVSARAVPPSAHPPDPCELRRHDLIQQPALAGAPQLEASRAEIVARAKSEPVLFLDVPEEPRDLSEEVAQLRHRIFQESYPWRALGDALSRYRRSPQVLRQIVLTEGYLYADKPSVAALLANNIVLTHLFNEPSLVVVRGNRTLHVERKGNEYYFSDGPDAGQLARLWLFDRVALTASAIGPSKLVSAAAIRDETGAGEVQVEHLTRDAIVATLVYPDARVPAVLAIRNDELHLECEVSLPPTDSAKVLAAKAVAKRQSTVMAHLRRTIDEEIKESLPFDEPKTEEGQQDGKLRQEWRSAYRNGLYKYEFNGDKYSVFGSTGFPRTPQVCVDFVVDSWERMAGTRWLAAREGRGRKVGRIDFDKLDIENRRSVDRLIEFARARPEWFDLLEFSELERIKFQDRQRFFKRLFDLRAAFQPGDVVAILGLRDDEKLHYHSFFIVAADPISGMPTQVAANAGRPRIRSWEGEMQNAPRRGILARIRPRLVWQEQLAGLREDAPQDLRQAEGSTPSPMPKL